MSYLITLGGALLAVAALVLGIGENPIDVFRIVVNSSLGSINDIGYTLFYATPLIFTGLAVALPYRLGLFNIGAEGQLYISSIFLFAAERSLANHLGVFSPWICLLVGMIGGGLWAMLAGVLKTWRGAHEVITTILLNFVAVSIVSFFVLYVWKDQTSQAPETVVIAPNSTIASLGFGDSPLNISILVGIFFAFILWFILKKSRLGLQMRAVGMNSEAVLWSGWKPSRLIWLSMFLAGACTAGVGLNEILGNSHRFKDGFSPGFGFMGIAVAFLANGNPLGVLISAAFMGALLKASFDLELETQFITRDFAVVLQAVLLIAVSLKPFIEQIILRRRHGK